MKEFFGSIFHPKNLEKTNYFGQDPDPNLEQDKNRPNTLFPIRL
jgi:hypothetical protein